MLPLGKIGLGFGSERDTRFTREEQKTMLTLWCIFGSPLMIGAELTKLDSWTFSLLTKEEILKLASNDYLGRQVERNGNFVIWSCYKENSGEKYVAYFNLHAQVQKIRFDWKQIEQFQISEGQEVIELWNQECYVAEGGVISAEVAPHGVKLFRCR